MRGTSVGSLSPHQSSIQGGDVDAQQLLGLFLRHCCPLRRERRVRAWLVAAPPPASLSLYHSVRAHVLEAAGLWLSGFLPRIISILLHDKTASHSRDLTRQADLVSLKHNRKTREKSSQDFTEETKYIFIVELISNKEYW